jgi:hypothetical protein
MLKVSGGGVIFPGTGIWAKGGPAGEDERGERLTKVFAVSEESCVVDVGSH